MASLRHINASEGLRHSNSTILHPTALMDSNNSLIGIPALGLLVVLIGLLMSISRTRRDAILFALLTAFFCRNQILQQISLIPTEIFWLLTPLLVINGVQVAYLSHIGGTLDENSKLRGSKRLKPLVFPTSTAHTRFFPRHHSFKYSYLLVGVPVEWSGSINNILSCNNPGKTSWWRDAWLSIHAEDYLFYSRSMCRSENPCLREKLDDYLRSQDVEPSLYLQAYLVTAPRVLGFSFNPVSFWYLYDNDTTLKAMILEVNNTFGERRMYLLQEPGEEEKNDVEEGERSHAGKGSKRFKSMWNKDFHVSPFNDREGVYSLTATDPFATGAENARINNIVTLSSTPYDALQPDVDTNSASSAQSLKPKVIASITSTSPAIHPSSITPLRKPIFLFSHALTGFLTNPRILFEARHLWSKGLKVWYRPEVSSSTIGREETKEETIIKKWFEIWIRGVSKRMKDEGKGVGVRYTPAAGESRGEKKVFENPAEGDRQETRDVDIDILTPAFYAELIRAPDMHKVWHERCFNAKDGEGMVSTNNSHAFREIIEKEIGRSASEAATRIPVTTVLERLNENLRSGKGLFVALWFAFWGCFDYTSKTKNSSSTSASAEEPMSFADIVLTSSREIMAAAHSEPSSKSSSNDLDIFTLNSASLRILLADRLAFGSTGLLHFYASPIRTILLIWGAWILSSVFV